MQKDARHPTGESRAGASAEGEQPPSPRITINQSGLCGECEPNFRWSTCLLDFPVSISGDGARIAAALMAFDESKGIDLEWIAIKDIENDAVEQTIDLIDAEFYARIKRDCRNPAHVVELERRIETANAVFIRDGWRSIPCTAAPGEPAPDECIAYRDSALYFDAPWLLVSHRARPLFSKQMSDWSPDRDSSCEDGLDWSIQFSIFDPPSGVLVFGLRFKWWEGACTPVPSDVHAIRLPALRGKPAQATDNEGDDESTQSP